MRVKKEVTIAQMRAFVAAYPRELEVDVSHICEPPLKTYNDFTMGNWPESVVAGYGLGSDKGFIWVEEPEKKC